MLAPPPELPPVLPDPLPPEVPIIPLEPVVVELDPPAPPVLPAPPDGASEPVSADELSSPAEEQPMIVARQRSPHEEMKLRMNNLQGRET